MLIRETISYAWLGLYVADGVVAVYPYAIVEAGAEVGEGCKIESFCFVEHGAILGRRVTLKPGVYVWDGVTLEDDVFVGPGVKFTNDSWPRVGRPCPKETTRIGHGASIGAGAIILPGAYVGAHSMVAAGAVLKKGIYAPALLWPRDRWGGEAIADPRCRDESERCQKCNPKPPTEKEEE